MLSNDYTLGTVYREATNYSQHQPLQKPIFHSGYQYSFAQSS